MASAAGLLAVSTSAPIPPILFGGEYRLYHDFAVALFDYINELKTEVREVAFWLRLAMLSDFKPRLWKSFCVRFIQVDDDVNDGRSEFYRSKSRLPEAERLLDCIMNRLLEYYAEWKHGAADPTARGDDTVYDPHPICTAVAGRDPDDEHIPEPYHQSRVRFRSTVLADSIATPTGRDCQCV